MSHRIHSLTAVSLGLLTSGVAHAQTLPKSLHVTSPKSSDGSFGLEIRGAADGECAEVISKVALDGGSSLQFHALRPCSYGVVPATKLAPGRYCITAPGFTGMIATPCFDVTGTAASPSDAVLSLAQVAPDSWLPASCVVCAGGGGQQSCTRRTRERSLRLDVQGVPIELVSRYAFATLDLATSSDVQPSEYHLLGVPPSESHGVRQRASDGRACVVLYAREFSANTGSKVGETCAEPVLPNTLPAAFRASSCESGYRERWCNENRADCSSGQELENCAGYLSMCGGGQDAGKVDAPSADGGLVSRGADMDSARSDAAPASTAGSGASSSSSRGSGCSLASTQSDGRSAGLWLACVAAWCFTRRRRRGRALARGVSPRVRSARAPDR